MRKLFPLALVIGIGVAIGVVAIAVAQRSPLTATCLRSAADGGGDCPGGLVARFGGGVVPKKLPTNEAAPVALKLWGAVSTENGGHPSALRELRIDFDRNLFIDVRGLPVCHPRLAFPIRRPPPEQEPCDKDTIVGKGRVGFEIAFEGQPPVQTASKLTAYNFGVKDGVLTVLAAVYITVPVPAAIVTRIEIMRIRQGHYGLRAVAKAPVIVGGAGSMRGFKLRLKRIFRYRKRPRTFLAARCPNRALKAKVSALFKNETETPSVAPVTFVQGGLTFACAPNG